MSQLNSQAFWKLLSTLDTDPERAGTKYEALRRRLVIFFEGRSCGHECDTLADTTLDRVAAKLEAAEVPDPGNLSAYSYGVARYVWKEWLAKPKQAPLTIDPPDTVRSDAKEFRHACLERCLGELAPESRKLIHDYYQGELGEKIANRARMAEHLEISPNALRRRAHFLRINHLEPCLKNCEERCGPG